VAKGRNPKWLRTKRPTIKLKETMHVVAEALREGNDIMRECHNFELPPILGEQTWNLIKDCACEVNELPKIYCSLIERC
jgi:hypothetical protein